MLTAQENELICRVGPGTPMGNLMRQYWLPAVTSDDLESDGPPRRVRLLGENLVAFRTTSGKVGLIAHTCPHLRIASLVTIHYKHLTAKRGGKYIAAVGVQHGATAARGYTAITVKDEETKEEAS